MKRRRHHHRKGSKKIQVMVSSRFGPLTRTAQLVRVLITEPIGPFLVFQLEDWAQVQHF